MPDFALAPPENIVDFDGDFNFNIAHSGDSQSLTPFGSQQSYSSEGGPLGGLVLPTSSPTPGGGGFQLHGDDEGTGLNALPVGDNGVALDEVDFAFDENGELIEGLLGQIVAGTPAARSGVGMQSDAAASAKVRKDHEEGRVGGVPVSFPLFLAYNALPSHLPVFSPGLLALTTRLSMDIHAASLGSPKSSQWLLVASSA